MIASADFENSLTLLIRRLALGESNDCSKNFASKPEKWCAKICKVDCVSFTLHDWQIFPRKHPWVCVCVRERERERDIIPSDLHRFPTRFINDFYLDQAVMKNRFFFLHIFITVSANIAFFNNSFLLLAYFFNRTFFPSYQTLYVENFILQNA